MFSPTDYTEHCCGREDKLGDLLRLKQQAGLLLFTRENNSDIDI